MGVGDDLAQYYFHQLVDGLEYIHSQGITHRDIKPENLLLSAGGDMKIADFGLCSVYKYKGKERSLKGACGSLPYIAPEMNGTPYKGEGVDVWSAGVVLFAMLAGNTPWDEPTMRSPEYTAYLDGSLLGFEPWNKIGESALSLVTSLLQPRPDLRLTLEGIRSHPWMQRPNRFLQTNISAEEKTGDLVQAFMEKMAEAGDLPLHTDGMRAEVPSAPASTQIEHVSGAATTLEEFEIKVPSASMGPAVGGDERAKRMMLSQSLANRRMATQTQNPHSTQFQELWAGMVRLCLSRVLLRLCRSLTCFSYSDAMGRSREQYLARFGADYTVLCRWRDAGGGRSNDANPAKLQGSNASLRQSRWGRTSRRATLARHEQPDRRLHQADTGTRAQKVESRLQQHAASGWLV